MQFEKPRKMLQDPFLNGLHIRLILSAGRLPSRIHDMMNGDTVFNR